jgi:Na+/H+ antiporter NhaD/arsenite permease-like protein
VCYAGAAMRPLLLLLFVLTYVGISARRMHLLPIGRPAMAMVGASAMVVAGSFAGPFGLTPDEALRAVEPHTLGMLFGMMVIAAGLRHAGFFAWLAERSTVVARTPAALLWAVTLASGLLSAVLVNDAVCLLASPVVFASARRLGAPERPFVYAVCMGANAGSAMTLGGNPQNMLVARLSGLAYRDYLAHAALPAIAALVITAAVLHAMFRRELTVTTLPATAASEPAPTDPVLLWVGLASLVAVVVANLAGASIAWSALVGASVVVMAARTRAEALLKDVEWSVLLFFASLFIVVAAFGKTGYSAEWLAPLTALAAGGHGHALLVAVLMLGSQIVSNVPLILLLEPWIAEYPDASSAWTTTAVVTTLAGNLTLLGSVANIIVIEQSRESIGFWDYLAIGVPVTLLSTLVALALLAAF